MRMGGCLFLFELFHAVWFLTYFGVHASRSPLAGPLRAGLGTKHMSHVRAKPWLALAYHTPPSGVSLNPSGASQKPAISWAGFGLVQAKVNHNNNLAPTCVSS